MTDDRMDQATPEYAAIIERDREWQTEPDGSWTQYTVQADPFYAVIEAALADRRALIALVREMRAALRIISDADGEGRARFLSPLLARTAPFQEPEEHPE